MARDVFTLSDSVFFGHLIYVRCRLCRRSHYYDPADLKRLMPDLPPPMVAQRMICETCRTGEYMVSSTESLPAVKRQGISVRRLERIVTIRRPVWVDE